MNMTISELQQRLDPRRSELHLALTHDQTAHLRKAGSACVDHSYVHDAESFIAAAHANSGLLPAELHLAIAEFLTKGSPTGALLMTGLPVFELPKTPNSPRLAIESRLIASGLLAMIASLVGYQYGYAAELSGLIIQGIIPEQGHENTQQSTGSLVRLFDHVETAFCPMRPDYVVLSCLKGDHEGIAGTTLASVEDIFPLLDERVIAILYEPRFKTRVDMSFMRGMGFEGEIFVGPISVFSGSRTAPSMQLDFAETSGLDSEARHALATLARAVDQARRRVVLKPGDLIILENAKVLHGRTPFTPRYDGTDRWLLRTFITLDFDKSFAVRLGGGRVVSYDYRELQYQGDNAHGASHKFN